LLESLIVYRTSDLKLQLDKLLQEEIEPLEKINKLIASYIDRINLNKGIYRILHFEFTSKKESKTFKRSEFEKEI
jgi:hypothetical protein